jgi:Orotate phosphoribosyltransferase
VSARFKQEAFNHFILSNKVIGLYDQPITLKSGKQSNWYVNWRQICSDVAKIDSISDAVLDFIHDKDIDLDCILGVPEGATKLGLLCHYKWAKAQSDFDTKAYPYPMGRQTAKEHGHPDDKYFVGAPEGNIVLLEDVATTGISMINFIKTLREANKNIVAAVSLTNRMDKNQDGKTVAVLMSELEIPYYSLSNGKELVQELITVDSVSSELKKTIETELLAYLF